MQPDLLNTLCCPKCRGRLAVTRSARTAGRAIFKGTLACKACGEEYPVEGGIPILVRPGFSRPVEGIDEMADRLGRSEVARRMLKGSLPPRWGVYGDTRHPRVTRTEIRRGGQLASLRHASRREPYSKDHAAEHLLRHLDLGSATRVLDACTGGGLLLSHLVRKATPSNPVIAFDISYEDLKYAEGGMKALGMRDRSTFVTGDVRQMPIADAGLDRIVSLAGYDHVEGFQAAIGEASRVLSPGGLFGIAGNTRRTVWGFEEFLTAVEQQTILRRQKVALGKDAILDALENSAFDVVRVDDFQAGWGDWYACVARRKP